MNIHDSDRLSGELSALGLEPASGPADADLILLNTCSVREKPAEKMFSYLGRLRCLKKNRPEIRIGVCGCVAQQEGERVMAREPMVDFVLGPRAIGRLAQVLSEIEQGKRGIVERSFQEFQEPRREAVPGDRRAFVVVSEGCDNFCTFCVVPYTRGREKSRPAGAVIEEVSRLAGMGFREVELLGQNVNSYRHGDVTFALLLRRVAAVPDILRVRFATSHPKDFSGDIIDAMRDCRAVCPHVHLPVQSGSSRVLALMNRKYTRADYVERIGDLRRAIPDAAVTTDVIAGFPGETEDDHRETLSLIHEVRFDAAYSFVYSPRPGTEAASLPDDVPVEVKARRLREVQELQDTIQAEKHAALVGKTLEVLVAGESRRGNRELTGRSPHHHVVNFRGGEELVGEIVRVTVTLAHAHSLSGGLQT